jgi:hypothetical protein
MSDEIQTAMGKLLSEIKIRPAMGYGRGTVIDLPVFAEAHRCHLTNAVSTSLAMVPPASAGRASCARSPMSSMPSLASIGA